MIPPQQRSTLTWARYRGQQDKRDTAPVPGPSDPVLPSIHGTTLGHSKEQSKEYMWNRPHCYPFWNKGRWSNWITYSYVFWRSTVQKAGKMVWKKNQSFWGQRDPISNLTPWNLSQLWFGINCSPGMLSLPPTLGECVLGSPSECRMLPKLVGRATDAKWPINTGRESSSAKNCSSQDADSVHLWEFPYPQFPQLSE